MNVSEESRPPLLEGRHVVLVLAGEVLGGAERAAVDLAVDLRDREGATVEICALDDRPGAGRRLAAAHEIPWGCLRVPWDGRRVENARSLVRFARRVRRMRPDVLLAVTNLPNAISGLTWRMTGASVFVWTQCDVNGTTRINERLFRYALNGSRLVVTKAEHGRLWLSESFGVDPERIHVIHEKVDLPPPRETGAVWRDKLGIGPDDFVACMLAHFHRGKDHVTLLRAWRSVVDALASTRLHPTLLLAGRDAGSEDAAKALAFDLDLRGHVCFLGEVTDVSGLLDASDIAVFSSHRELFARGATEPMGAGLPVVGTDIPGIREAVGEQGEPFLAPPGDPDSLAEAIVRLALDPDLRARVGRANAELIRVRHNEDASSHLYATLLADALTAASPRARG